MKGQRNQVIVKFLPKHLCEFIWRGQKSGALRGARSRYIRKPDGTYSSNPLAMKTTNTSFKDTPMSLEAMKFIMKYFQVVRTLVCKAGWGDKCIDFKKVDSKDEVDNSDTEDEEAIQAAQEYTEGLPLAKEVLFLRFDKNGPIPISGSDVSKCLKSSVRYRYNDVSKYIYI